MDKVPDWLTGIDNLLYVRELERCLLNPVETAVKSAEGHSAEIAPTGMSVDEIGQVPHAADMTRSTARTG